LAVTSSCRHLSTVRVPIKRFGEDRDFAGHSCLSKRSFPARITFAERYSRTMIEGISILRPAGDAAVYDHLASFFSVLGVAPRKGREGADGRSASFLAPLGSFEFVNGQFPSASAVLIEVTALDALHQAASIWLQTEGGYSEATRLSPITETHWMSSMFAVVPQPGFTFTFWARTDRPVAGQTGGCGWRSLRGWNEVCRRHCPVERRDYRAASRWCT
jgi:hypothetical protein